jgi:hypothetical protein
MGWVQCVEASPQWSVRGTASRCRAEDGFTISRSASLGAMSHGPPAQLHLGHLSLSAGSRLDLGYLSRVGDGAEAAAAGVQPPRRVAWVGEASPLVELDRGEADLRLASGHGQSPTEVLLPSPDVGEADATSAASVRLAAAAIRTTAARSSPKGAAMPASLPRPVAARGSVAGGNGRNRAAARGETRITGKRFATYSRTARAFVSRTCTRSSD